MISNHNRNNSSFRIIEPKQQSPLQFQHALQTPINLQQHIPILTNNQPNLYTPNSMNNSHYNHSSSGNYLNSSRSQNSNIHNNNNFQRNNNNSSNRMRNLSDTDSSYIPETTSESGISDLDMSEKCTCCPYGYHIDTDFVTFLHDLGGKNLNKQLKKIQRKRDVKLQRSMEYVIDEVEKLRLLNEDTGNYVADRPEYTSSPLHTTHSYTPNPNNYSLNQSSNIYSHSVTPTNISQQQQQQQQRHQQSILVQPVLKKTINKIDKLANETNELFSGNSSLNNETSRKLKQGNSSNNLAGTSPNMQDLPGNSRHHSSNNFLNLGNSNYNNSSSSLPQQQRNIINTVHNMQHQHKTQCSCNNTTNNNKFQPDHRRLKQQRSYSSCAEPINNSPNIAHSCIYTRRCASNRSSPIRQQPPAIQQQFVYSSNPKICTTERVVRSRSHSRRSKSRSPVQQVFRREVKINLAGPKRRMDEEEHIINNNQMEERIVTTTVNKPQRAHKPASSVVSVNPIRPEVQEEVLLNLFSCNNSGSVSSDSSESLVEYENPNLKINEVYEKRVEERKVFKQQPPNNNHLLEKRLAELEKKLRRLPELEIKNNILAEEKQMLIKQLLNMKQPVAPVPQAEPPQKMYRSIGSNSNDSEFKRDMATECRAVSRDVGLTTKLEEPREEIQKMETIITTLRDKLSEQTLILEKALIKPITRDVAIMHSVDKVEKPKPELRDVAINHRTEVDNKELIEKHTLIVNTYIKEIEQLRLENVKLSQSLEELIKKHSKHVVTRGTHAPDQPILYSVGVNTAKVQTRDVQVMFTPKSRDVSMATDRFSNTRDVALMCNIGDLEFEKQMLGFMDIKTKYEAMIQERLSQVKSYRDVAMAVNLDAKDQRSVALGCNLIETKQTRDVSMKCDLDKELRSFREVAIACNLYDKDKKDAAVMINTIPPPPITKDFSTNVLFEDHEKTDLTQELARLKLSLIKSTRDVGVYVDQRSRLMEDQMRNRSSSMENVKTQSRQINTESKTTKDFSVGTEFGDETHELELKTYHKQLVEEQNDKIKLNNMNSVLQNRLDLMEEELNQEKEIISILNSKLNSKSQRDYQNTGVNTMENTFKNQSSSNTDLSSLNEKIDLKISESILKKKDDNLSRRRETEYEQRKITTYDPKNKKRDETMTVNYSATNSDGNKIMESATFSTTTPLTESTNKPLYLTEMSIPIFNESTKSFNGLTDETVESKEEKTELKKPKSILKSSMNDAQSQKKALTFGENRIDSFQSESGSEQSLDDEVHNAAPMEDEEEELYETPITTIENQTAESDQSHRIKTEHSNNLTDYDDYELQEQLMTESLSLSDSDASKAGSQRLRRISAENEQEESDNTIKSTNAPSTPAKPIIAGKKAQNQTALESFELELELHIACAILNDSLYEPLKADKNKVARALNLIQQDWFKLAAKKDSNPMMVEAHLNSFYTRFSNLLLERIVNMADLILNTALHYSVSNGNFEIVNLLLDTKVCDVNSQNKAGGYTSIMLAALVPVTNEYERMTLNRLFSEGNVNIKSNDNGQTALMLAVMHGNKDTVALLLAAGSDCNLQDKEGSTALMAACEHGHIEIVRILLNNTNCDPDIKDNDGETAFDISKKKQRNDIIVLLYAHSSKLRSHHPAIQFSKSRPKFNSSPLKK